MVSVEEDVVAISFDDALGDGGPMLNTGIEAEEVGAVALFVPFVSIG